MVDIHQVTYTHISPKVRVAFSVLLKHSHSSQHWDKIEYIQIFKCFDEYIKPFQNSIFTINILKLGRGEDLVKH